MENASKALLIAGAILICILLIAVGMYIYSSATGAVESAASKMSSTDKDIYNSTVSSYLGNSVKGSAVRSMIDAIISSNQSNVGQTGKFISIATEDIKSFTDTTEVSSGSEKTNLQAACQACDFYAESGQGDNNGANVKKATAAMTFLKEKINTGKNYTVTADYEAGVIIRVNIKQNAE